MKNYAISKILLASGFVIGTLVQGSDTQAQNRVPDLTCSDELRHLYITTKQPRLTTEQRLEILTAARNQIESALRSSDSNNITAFVSKQENENLLVVSERSVYERVDENNNQTRLEWFGSNQTTTPLREFFKKHHFTELQCYQNQANKLASGYILGVGTLSISFLLPNTAKTQIGNKDIVPLQALGGLTGGLFLYVFAHCAGTQMIRKLNEGFTPAEKRHLIKTLKLIDAGIAELKQQSSVKNF